MSYNNIRSVSANLGHADGLQIVSGDFNTDLLNENLGARGTFENIMNSQGLDLVSLREPTRDTATSSTCIDAKYSNFLFSCLRC